MAKALKIMLVVALTATLVAGLATATGCDASPTDNPDDNGVSGGEDPAELDITSAPGLVVDCEEYTGGGFKYGDPAPVFTFEDALGHTYSLSDFHGKYVILNFWKTNCGWCKLEMPYLEQVAADWADEDVVLITIDTGDSAETVDQYLSDNGFTLPIILDREFLVTAQYRVSGVPLTVFLDREGLIRFAQPGAFQSVEAIEEILELILAL